MLGNAVGARAQRAKLVQAQTLLTRERELHKAKTGPLAKAAKLQNEVLQKAESRERLQQQQLVRRIVGPVGQGGVTGPDAIVADRCMRPQRASRLSLARPRWKGSWRSELLKSMLTNDGRWKRTQASVVAERTPTCFTHEDVVRLRAEGHPGARRTQHVLDLQLRLDRHTARVNEVTVSDRMPVGPSSHLTSCGLRDPVARCIVLQVQAFLAERTATAERESHTAHRLQEESAVLRRRVEKLEKVTTVTDESLQVINRALLVRRSAFNAASRPGRTTAHAHEPEEWGRGESDHQDKIKCSVCKLNDKNTVITRCYHVFCESCVKTRMDTRQRKCPSCGDAFGVNDVQRIFLTS